MNTQHTVILLLSVARHKSRCVGRLKLPSLLAVDIAPRRNSSAPICMNTQQLEHENSIGNAKEATLLAPLQVFVSAEMAAECDIPYTWIQI
eukprot:scaffold1697_cov108-Skeletonema_menzelii.AAC.3